MLCVKTIRTATLAVLFPAALLAAPRPTGPADAEVLAIIDGEAAVTVGDIVAYRRENFAGTDRAPLTAADVETWVDTFVTARILVLEAEALGYGAEEDLQKEIDAYRHARLRERMYEILVSEDPVTDSDLREFFSKDSKWRKCALIETKNRAAAEAAYRDLEEGRPWPEVVRAYSLREETWEAAGVSHTPLVFDGRPASEVIFATPVGEYTVPVPAADRIRWQIYRIDKIVHGRIDTFEGARDRLRATVEGLRGRLRAQHLAAELRPSVPISRNEQMWEALQHGAFSDFRTAWATTETTASDVGGLAVTGEEFCNLINTYFFMPDEGVNMYREEDPEDFAYVTDLLLRKLEDEALVEYEALQRGLDLDLQREFANYRAELLTDRFITQEFVAKLPPITGADCEAYYEAHKEEFVVPEKVEVYLVAVPGREKSLALYEEIKAGADIVDTNEAYNQARGRELMGMYDPPPVLPPEQQEWRGVVAVTREPGAEGPDGPFAEDLRPRLYPFGGLNNLSEVFQLRDGRWAFYEPIFYQPFKQEGLDDDDIVRQCQKRAWAEYYAGDDVNAQSLAWLASLRARHDVELATGLFAAAASLINDARD